MPRLRINLRDMSDLDELDLIDEVDQMATPEDRAGERDDKRAINPLALQRRQDSRKFGKDIARIQRQNKDRLKP
ncbi:MAG: hypothetical protein HGB28_03190 [Oscillochloris sp.]|nr:hypothetical protein [Oscillochloris sp.]